LIVVSLVLVVCSASYAVISSYRVLLAVVVVHGLFWSGLLSASGAYMTATVPESRRAEGLGYWGMASVFAIALAPAIGFLVYRAGWFVLCAEIAALNLLMAVIAWRLPDDRAESAAMRAAEAAADGGVARRSLVEWRVVLLAITMSLISFGYGSLTSFSALFADELRVAPRSLFLTAMATSILFVRFTIGRHADRVGHRRVLLPALATSAAGLLLLAFAQGLITFVAAAVVFGAGFGLMYPAFTAYVIRHVSFSRRGAAFGAILAAFDGGIGTGSSMMGWLIGHVGYRAAYVFAASLGALAVPYFVAAEKRLGFSKAPVDT
jgi:MFS family permease